MVLLGWFNNNICPFCGSDSSNIIEIEETIEKKNKESITIEEQK